jgi:hypothetical protein
MFGMLAAAIFGEDEDEEDMCDVNRRGRPKNRKETTVTYIQA